MVETEDYKISFFRPTTHRARLNRNLTVKLFIAWAVAIFGFQVLLKIIEKPVPEEGLLSFSAAWEKIETEAAEVTDYQAAARPIVQVLGKSSLKDGEYEALKDALGWIVARVITDEELIVLQEEVIHLNLLKNQITSLKDEAYLKAKETVGMKAGSALGLEVGSLLSQLLPLALDNDLISFSSENKMKVPDIMSTYMIHNRSVLTDTIFLGFPFHYFYTAVFLLIFFIGLCWFYCYRTDRVHARLNFTEQTS
jgi:putative solute:sodium symporter small subunit